MRQLRDDTHLILDGEVRVHRRERSKRWMLSKIASAREGTSERAHWRA